jgi:hypothetical protein
VFADGAVLYFYLHQLIDSKTFRASCNLLLAQLSAKRCQTTIVSDATSSTFALYLADAAHAGDVLTLVDASQNCYVFNSCLRRILLGCRSIRHKKISFQRTKRAGLRATIACSEVRV